MLPLFFLLASTFLNITGTSSILHQITNQLENYPYLVVTKRLQTVDSGGTQNNKTKTNARNFLSKEVRENERDIQGNLLKDNVPILATLLVYSITCGNTVSYKIIF